MKHEYPIGPPEEEVTFDCVMHAEDRCSIDLPCALCPRRFDFDLRVPDVLFCMMSARAWAALGNRVRNATLNGFVYDRDPSSMHTRVCGRFTDDRRAGTEAIRPLVELLMAYHRQQDLDEVCKRWDAVLVITDCWTTEGERDDHRPTR